MAKYQMRHLVNHFIKKNPDVIVTAKDVQNWVIENFGYSINIRKLGQHLGEHKSFKYIKRIDRGSLYEVTNLLDDWMTDLEGL